MRKQLKKGEKKEKQTEMKEETRQRKQKNYTQEIRMKLRK